MLDDVNLELKRGSVVAIVGENGAGKSTLVKLLCRMYQPDQGRILVDGVDLARIRADDWRARVPGRSRISSASSFARAIRWALATCPGWMTSPR